MAYKLSIKDSIFMVWLCPMWHFFHVATIWKSSLRDSIYNLLTYTNHSPSHQTKNQTIHLLIRPKTKEPKQTTPPPCATWAAQPSSATWSRNPASWGASKLRWALSPQILSLSDLMSFGVFIFLIRILGGCWGGFGWINAQICGLYLGLWIFEKGEWEKNWV